MSPVAGLADASAYRTLALALIHFLWQGTLVALLLAAANLALGRGSARARYAAASAALAAMLALPVATAWRLQAAGDPTIPSGVSPAPPSAASSAPLVPWDRHSARGFIAATAPWIVSIWLAGVAGFSARFCAGCLAVRRLVRRGTRRADADREARLGELARRLGVRRAVRLLESGLVQVPTAIGVLRPVVLVPIGIVTALPCGQLDSLLAHELAHIRRADFLVNVFQALAEALLFYHPAVWWVSSRVRIEREHACDDLAVAATGDAVTYARALLDLEDRRRTSPALAVAADGGQLWRRVTRLVPPARAQAHSPSRWLAGALALGAVLALVAATYVPPVPANRQDGSAAPAASGRTEARTEEQAPSPAPSPAAEPVPEAQPGRSRPEPAPRPTASAPARGLLSPEDLISFRIHGVTPEFVGEILALGYTKSSPDQLVELRIHGVTPEYIREMTAPFGRLPLERYVEFRIHGLTPESLRQLESNLGKLSADDALSMRIHGVDAEFVAAFRAAGYPALSADEAVSLRIHGATPEYAHALKAQGFPQLSLDDLVAFRIHGVTPEFVSAIRGLGYTALSPDDVTAFRIHGLTPESIRAMNERAGGRLSPDELVDRRIHARSSSAHKEDEP